MENNDKENRGYQPNGQFGYQPQNGSKAHASAGSNSGSTSAHTTNVKPPAGSNAKDA